MSEVADRPVDSIVESLEQLLGVDMSSPVGVELQVDRG